VSVTVLLPLLRIDGDTLGGQGAAVALCGYGERVRLSLAADTFYLDVVDGKVHNELVRYMGESELRRLAAACLSAADAIARDRQGEHDVPSDANG